MTLQRFKDIDWFIVITNVVFIIAVLTIIYLAFYLAFNFKSDFKAPNFRNDTIPPREKYQYFDSPLCMDNMTLCSTPVYNLDGFYCGQDHIFRCIHNCTMGECL